MQAVMTMDNATVGPIDIVDVRVSAPTRNGKLLVEHDNIKGPLSYVKGQPFVGVVKKLKVVDYRLSLFSTSFATLQSQDLLVTLTVYFKVSTDLWNMKERLKQFREKVLTEHCLTVVITK